MSGPSIFLTIHWVGVGFIFLWFLGSSMKEGMWNNAITCFNAFVAAMIALPLGGALMGLALSMFKPDPTDPYTPLGILIVAEWLSYIVGFLVLTTFTEYLSKVRVAFHPVVNGIGSFILICGTTLVLFVFACMGMAAVQAGAR